MLNCTLHCTALHCAWQVCGIALYVCGAVLHALHDGRLARPAHAEPHDVRSGLLGDALHALDLCQHALVEFGPDNTFMVNAAIEVSA